MANERRTEALLAKLDVPVAAHFPKETTLREFLEFVRSQTKSDDTPNGIPIYLDPVGLNEAEKTTDSPITLDLEGVPLRVTIRLALEQLGLEYRVRDGLLAIICKDMEGALTPLTELQDKAERGELTQDEANELTQMLGTRVKIMKLQVELDRLEAEKATLNHRQFPETKVITH